MQIVAVMGETWPKMVCWNNLKHWNILKPDSIVRWKACFSHNNQRRCITCPDISIWFLNANSSRGNCEAKLHNKGFSEKEEIELITYHNNMLQACPFPVKFNQTFRTTTQEGSASTYWNCSSTHIVSRSSSCGITRQPNVQIQRRYNAAQSVEKKQRHDMQKVSFATFPWASWKFSGRQTSELFNSIGKLLPPKQHLLLHECDGGSGSHSEKEETCPFNPDPKQIMISMFLQCCCSYWAQTLALLCWDKSSTSRKKA